MNKIYQKESLRLKIPAKCKSGGFTLIELLVVALIIGILAGAAWPQYRKAVARARIGQAVVKLNAMEKAHQEYFMQNGVYTADQSNLSISLDMPACQAYGYWGFCQTTIEGFPQLSLEWFWRNGTETEHRCFAVKSNKLANDICAMYGAEQDFDGRNVYLMNF